MSGLFLLISGAPHPPELLWLEAKTCETVTSEAPGGKLESGVAPFPEDGEGSSSASSSDSTRGAVPGGPHCPRAWLPLACSYCPQCESGTHQGCTGGSVTGGFPGPWAQVSVVWGAPAQARSPAVTQRLCTRGGHPGTPEALRGLADGGEARDRPQACNASHLEVSFSSLTTWGPASPVGRRGGTLHLRGPALGLHLSSLVVSAAMDWAGAAYVSTDLGPGLPGLRLHRTSSIPG